MNWGDCSYMLYNHSATKELHKQFNSFTKSHGVGSISISDPVELIESKSTILLL